MSEETPVKPPMPVNQQPNQEVPRPRNDVFNAPPMDQRVQSPHIRTEQDLGIEIPVVSVPLPSRGVLYPQGSSLHGRETLDIRAMTASEEDILTSEALINKGIVVTRLIQACLVDKTIDVDKMLSADKNALMIAIRITGYGADYKTTVTCSGCSEKVDSEFDLSKLPIKRLPIDPIEPGKNEFLFHLPVTKKQVTFKFTTGEDESEISKISEKMKKSGSEIGNSVTTKLKYHIKSIEGIGANPAKIDYFVRRMPAKDSRALRNYIENNEPGIEMVSEFTCPRCGQTSEVNLPFGASFFWPDF